jgi:hypothetical protein
LTEWVVSTQPLFETALKTFSDRAAREACLSPAHMAGIVLIAIVVAVVAFWQVQSAQFTGDDWHFLALLRNIDSTLDVLTSNVGGSYYYRPTVLLLFWLSIAAFGIDPAWHYGVNVVLHLWVSFEVFALARRLSERQGWSAWAALFFIALPATAATPLWISDRFDLIATGAMLLSTRLLIGWLKSAQRIDKALFGSMFISLIAFGSKETAFALVPAHLMLVAIYRERVLTARIKVACAIVLTAGFALLCRYFALDGWTGKISPPVNFETVFAGVGQWFRSVPVAIQTQHGATVLGAISVFLFAGLMLRRGFERRPLPQRAIATIGALVLVALGAITAQSSVAALILPRDSGPLATATLRLFYTPFAFVCVSIGVALASIKYVGVYRLAANSLGLAGLLTCAYGSALQSAGWAGNTIAEHSQAIPWVQEYAAAAEAAKHGRPCVVRFPDLTAHLTDIDLRFKATLNPSDKRINCVLLTNPPQASVITRATTCSFASVAPLHSAFADLQPMVRSGTCTFFFLIE